MYLKTYSLFAQACNVQDSLALVDLYDSTDGKNWLDQTGWFKGPVSTWNGIKEQNGRVVKILLIYNALKGTIPSSLGNLGQLQQLKLAENF